MFKRVDIQDTESSKINKQKPHPSVGASEHVKREWTSSEGLRVYKNRFRNSCNPEFQDHQVVVLGPGACYSPETCRNREFAVVLHTTPFSRHAQQKRTISGPNLQDLERNR